MAINFPEDTFYIVIAVLIIVIFGFGLLCYGAYLLRKILAILAPRVAEPAGYYSDVDNPHSSDSDKSGGARPKTTTTTKKSKRRDAGAADERVTEQEIRSGGDGGLGGLEKEIGGCSMRSPAYPASTDDYYDYNNDDLSIGGHASQGANPGERGSHGRESGGHLGQSNKTNDVYPQQRYPMSVGSNYPIS